MLADERRLEAYQRALSQTIRPGDVVVDVGAGTGVLSVMAVRAGAARVYAIDRSVQEPLLSGVLKQNGVADRVTVIAGESREVVLPERADVLIAEIGLDEETLWDARERLLRPGGRIVPRVVSMCMAPVCASAQYAHYIEFWAERHANVDVAPFRKAAANTIHRCSLEGINLLSNPRVVLEANVALLDNGALSGWGKFVINSDTLIHGMAAWHRIELTDGVWHENAPPGPPESWFHNFIPFSTPLRADTKSELHITVVKRGDIWIWRGTCGTQSFDQSTFSSLSIKNVHSTVTPKLLSTP